MNSWIAAQIGAGSYTNDSGAIRDLIRREQERGLEIESIRQALTEGQQSGEPEPFDLPRSSGAKRRSMVEYWLSPTSMGMFDHTVAYWGLSQAMRYTDIIEAACADLAEAPERAQGCANI